MVTGWLGRERRLARARSRRRRGRAVALLGPHPGKTPEQGAGWGGSGRAAVGSAVAAKLGSPRAPLGGSSQAWRKEARPDPPPAAARLREGGLPGVRRGVGRWGVGLRDGAPCRALGALRGVCSRPRPAPSCPPAVKASSPEGTPQKADLPALQPPPVFNGRSSSHVEVIEAGSAPLSSTLLESFCGEWALLAAIGIHSFISRHLMVQVA